VHEESPKPSRNNKKKTAKHNENKKLKCLFDCADVALRTEMFVMFAKQIPV
jgi:hypothetical protein